MHLKLKIAITFTKYTL